MVPPCVAFGASPPGGRRQRPGKAGSAASAWARWLACAVLGLLAALAVGGAHAQSKTPDSATGGALAQEKSAISGTARTHGAVPQPVIDKARAGTQCVEDPAYMRRNHMKLLKHQRDDTLRGGVRQGRHSLKECIACHANRQTNSVAATNGNFCQSCHAYAAVKIDCFECHATQPAVKP